MIRIRTHTVWITIFFSPKTFNDAAVDFCIMRRFNGMCRSFLSCKLDKGISLVFEYSYVLNGTKRRKGFLYQLIRDTIRKTSTIYGTIGRTTLVIYLFVVGFTIVGMPRPLRPRWRRFPSGPVGPDAARTQPLTVHRVDRRFGLGFFNKRHERVALALERLRVADDPAVADLAKGRERLLESLRLDLRREIADEDVMVVAGVEFRLIAWTGRPVNLHLLVEERALVHGGQRRGRALVVRKFDEGIRIVAGLADYLASLHGADLRKERTQKVLGYRGV